MIDELLSVEDFKKHLWEVALKYDFKSHPWYLSVTRSELTRKQVIAGLTQQFLRVRRNNEIFSNILNQAKKSKGNEIIKLARSNYEEERDHTALFLKLFLSDNLSDDDLVKTLPTTATGIAIEATLNFCRTRTALEGMAFVSFVEAQNAGADGVAMGIYNALINIYNFPKDEAETFLIHATADVHGLMQIDLICQKAATLDLQRKITQAVRLGTAAFSLERDGYLQAAEGHSRVWAGI